MQISIILKMSILLVDNWFYKVRLDFLDTDMQQLHVQLAIKQVDH